jgi:hypothetical protein
MTTPHEVFREVFSSTGDRIAALRASREHFGLDARQAKEVMLQAEGTAPSLAEHEGQLADVLERAFKDRAADTTNQPPHPGPNRKKPDPPWPDPRYEQNRAKFPLEELAKYAGQYVAFSIDGMRILAGADTMEAVEEKLIAAGIDPSRVVGSYIDGPDDDCFLGGAILFMEPDSPEPDDTQRE